MWQQIAEVTFTPDNVTEVVGSFSLVGDDDILWVRVTQIGEPSPNPWSYGILSWRSSEGHELGSTKCYGNARSEVFRIGVGRPPLKRDGVITFEPRGFNLGWIREGFPWTLKFEAASGSTAISPPSSEPQATLMVPAVPEGNALPSYEILDGLAWLLFNIFSR